MRRLLLPLITASLALLPSPQQAQTHRIKKPETVVRALGVYEWTGEEGKASASRFIPVSVFINAQFEDAGVYLARPVPFALETGTLFEVERAGVSRGTLELAYARHVQTGDAEQYDDGWLGVGAFKLKPKPAVFAAKKSGPLPQVAVNGGKGPKFSSKSGDASKSTNASPESASSGSTSSGSASETSPSKSEVDRSTAVGAGTTVSAGTADQPASQKKPEESSVDPTDDADRPTLKRRVPAQKGDKKKQGDQASVAGVGQLNDDPDRPNLHRGKPVTRMEEQDLPPLKGLPKDMQQEAAVSDAKDRPEHDFARPWESDAERADITAKMQAIARTQLAQYGGQAVAAAAQTSAVSTSHPATRPAITRKRSSTTRAGSIAKASISPAISLSDEVLKSYTLSYGGAATYVYSASSPVYSASSPNASGTTRYVSIVAQRESLGAFKVALTSVTDSTHLDRTPWMRLVDAVDADASNRASLLFELRAQSTRQFALYRVIGAQAEQLFINGTTP